MKVSVTASMETRITRIIAEYTGAAASESPRAEPSGTMLDSALDEATRSQLEAALRSLHGFFGAARTEELVAQLRAGNLRPLVRTLLEQHYDPRYRHAMRNYTYALTVSAEDLDAAAAELAAFGRGLDAAPAGTSPAALASGS